MLKGKKKGPNRSFFPFFGSPLFFRARGGGEKDPLPPIYIPPSSSKVLFLGGPIYQNFGEVRGWDPLIPPLGLGGKPPSDRDSQSYSNKMLPS